MSFLESLPNEAHLGDVFARFDRGLDPLMRFHDAVLRGESALSIAERELLAAYVSSQNDCQFCFNSHRVYAAKYGIEPTLFDAINEDLDSAPVSPRMRALLGFARKLTLQPARVLQQDTHALVEAGWSDEAIHDAILVIGLFNMMNRIIFGHGISPHASLYEQRLEQTLQTPANEREAANQSDIDQNNYQAFANRATADRKAGQ